MAQVFTVLGAIAPESMGITAMHEHILFGMPGWEHQPEELFNHTKAFEKIRTELLDFKSLGGQTLVDCSGISLGRDVEFYQALSKVTGVNIVSCTGFWAERAIPGHFTYHSAHGPAKEPDYIAQIFVDELTKGMITGLMRRTEVRAGLIKVGNSEDRITGGEENFFRAAARAAKRTGAAVTTHGSAMARQQLEILVEEGLNPSRIIIGHCDDSPNIERDKEIARKGAYVGYDRAAYNSPGKDRQRVELVKAMVDAGFARQILISCDAIGYGIGYSKPHRSYRYLLSDFVKELHQAGLSKEIIHTILVENPARVLSY